MSTQTFIKKECDYRATNPAGWYTKAGTFLGKNIKIAAANHDGIMKRINDVGSIKAAIAHHEKWSKAGGWGPIAGASARRKAESDSQHSCVVEHEGDRYEVFGSASVSCRWVRYSSCFTINGVQKDVRLFKKLLEIL